MLIVQPVTADWNIRVDRTKGFSYVSVPYKFVKVSLKNYFYIIRDFSIKGIVVKWSIVEKHPFKLTARSERFRLFCKILLPTTISTRKSAEKYSFSSKLVIFIQFGSKILSEPTIIYIYTYYSPEDICSISHYTSS